VNVCVCYMFFSVLQIILVFVCVFYRELLLVWCVLGVKECE